VRFEITVVNVASTFVHVKITMRGGITVCVYKSRIEITHIHTHTCQTYSCVCIKHTIRVKSHFACENLTLRVEINLVRVEITLMRIEITLSVLKFNFACLNHNRACRNHIRKCHIHTHTCQNLTRVCVKSHSWVLKLHSACRNFTLRV
jgi:hypothetical protein